MKKLEKRLNTYINRLIAPVLCAVISFSLFMPVDASDAVTAVAGRTEDMFAAVYAYADYEILLENAVYVSGGADDGIMLTDRRYTEGKTDKKGELPEGWVIVDSYDGKTDYTVTVTVDLGFAAQNVSKFYLRTFKSVDANADMPRSIKFYISKSGSSFEYVGNGSTMTDTTTSNAAAIYSLNTEKGYTARYARVVMECDGSSRLYLNEVGIAEEGSVFRANYSRNGILRDEQGLIYKISDGTAKVIGFETSGISANGVLAPSDVSFDKDDIVYTLGVGSNNEVKVTADFIGEGRPNYSGVPNNIKYIIIHNTGTTEDSTGAERYNLRMHTTDGETSWHYTVDDEQIYHSLADSVVGWHAGSTHNYESIGIEICTNGAPTDLAGNIIFKGSAYDSWVNNHFRKALKNTAMLTAELLTRYGLGTDAVIQHYDVTEKNCPLWMRYKNGSFVYEGTLWTEFMGYVDEYYRLFNGDGTDTEFTPKRNVIIPDYITVYGGQVYPVSGIGAGAFSNKGEFLQSVVIGKYITSIVPDCFDGSDGLSRVSVADGNTEYTVDADGIVTDCDGNIVFDPNVISIIPPNPKDGCKLDIREINGKYYIFTQNRYSVNDLVTEYGAKTAKAVSANGESLIYNDIVGTGTVLTFDKSRLYIVMRGDVNGDSLIDQFDYILIKRMYYETYIPSRSQIYASALTNGESIDVLDYVLIKRHVMGTYNIDQG